jgi:ABC-type Fe3+-hydroxamate transport system substrate-binding protein
MVQRFLVDAMGVKHLRAESKPRIISLVPSITELLFALGVGRM